MKHLAVGILAHVDAGKTTLSEAVLFKSGQIRKLGRVDHQDAFLDTNELERRRGITIFSKQAVFPLGDMRVTLLDTPGHVDFSSEMERTLQVLDYAVLVINGADGVQGHTETLWELLKQYEIPTFLFVNKMDQPGTDRDRLLSELKQKLYDGCIAFDGTEAFYENIAMADEAVLESYLETGSVNEEEIRKLIWQRKVFPCYFGSALKTEGVGEFLQGLKRYMKAPDYPEAFGAKVYKISRDSQGNRLTHMKITGGSLKVKELLSEEKVNQIRIYSGEKFEAVQEAEAGCICAVTGLTGTYPGEAFGVEEASKRPVLAPVLNYKIELPKGCDAHVMLRKLRELEEEDPQLHVVWNETPAEIHVQLMGEVQTEILKSLIEERFGICVGFGNGAIVYKETITEPAEGVGHFEPLRHYAEVHLLIEPGERGSGLVFASDVSEDVLDKNWQRLILTHLAEKEHKGVLTGSAITDMKITLVNGRAHLKHTEGGDFRQATYRAVRQGLKKTKSILLEPYYEFRLSIPSEMTGRALNDIQRINGTFSAPQPDGEMSVLTGSAPVALMRDYPLEVTTYTKGRGRISLRLKGYEPCHNEQEVVEALGYDSECDMENPTGSVFCAHGAGFHVSWDEVEKYQHLPNRILPKSESEETKPVRTRAVSSGKRYESNAAEEKELHEIFIRTYGKIEKPRKSFAKSVTAPTEKRRKKEAGYEEFLLVDGYNVIFAWEDLKELAKENIEAARNKLMDVLCNYQGYRNCNLILVFDAYKVEGNRIEIQKYNNIHVVYTKEAETADQYIEKVVHEIGRKYRVTVATSDGVEQIITLGQGGTLISARELLEEIELMMRSLREEYLEKPEKGKNYLFDYMDEELVREMEEIRLGNKIYDKKSCQK